jgi:tetratricopeptide (TPR) repeat protein
MSMTLNLAQRLLALGQNYQQLGRNHDALRYLGRLAGFRDLEPEVAERTQISLAEIYLARRHFHKARRHLTAALAHQPNNARYHHLMAVAWAADEKGDRRRAADHYRQALRLDSDQPHCLSEFGLLALEIGQTEEGFQCLFRAAELAPNDSLVVGRLAEGLVQEDRIDEARRALQAALFRNSRDARFRKLWNDFQFQQLQQQQQRGGYTNDGADDAEGPTLLPFVRGAVPQAGAAPGPAKIIRCDGPAAPAAPHKTGRRGLPRRRHAQ